MTNGMYPGGAPTITGGRLNIDLFLKSPSRVRKAVYDMTAGRWVSSVMFDSGDATGGAVVYDVTTALNNLTDRDIESIAPGGDFPKVGDTDPEPKVAKTTKRGAIIEISREAVMRNDEDQLVRKMRKLRNRMLSTHNRLALGTLLNHPDVRRGAAATPWNVANSDPYADLVAGTTAVESPDELDYVIDLAIINHQEARSLLSNKEIRNGLPRDIKADNPILSRQIANLAGIEKWIVTGAMPAGKMVMANSKVVGSIRDEEGEIESDVWMERSNQVWNIQAWRSSVPIITDPLACIVVEGLHS